MPVTDLNQITCELHGLCSYQVRMIHGGCGRRGGMGGWHTQDNTGIKRVSYLIGTLEKEGVMRVPMSITNRKSSSNNMIFAMQ